MGKIIIKKPNLLNFPTSLFLPLSFANKKGTKNLRPYASLVGPSTNQHFLSTVQHFSDNR